MPEIGKFADVYPGTLFGEIAAQRQGREWQVLNVSERFLARLTLRLQAERIPFYCPYVESQRQWADRRKTLFFPLFFGYVFVLGDLDERKESVRLSQHVQQIFFGEAVGDQTTLTSELITLRAVTTCGRPVETVNVTSILGRSVRITSGPFAGYSGRVIKEQPPFRFLVGIEALSLYASVEVDASEFEVLD